MAANIRDVRTIESEAVKAADSHIAGFYIQEARMIHPIFAPLKYCNLRYSMRCIFKLILFCSSSKTKISCRGISKGGFRYFCPLEIRFIFHNLKGEFQNPWNPPLATPLSKSLSFPLFLTTHLCWSLRYWQTRLKKVPFIPSCFTKYIFTPHYWL